MSVAQSETAPCTVPVLRLLPAPSADPPYDDELPEAVGLRLVTDRGLAPALRGPLAPMPALRLVPTPGSEAAPGPRLERGDAAERTPLADLPPVGPFARALIQRLLEVLAGLRPLGQLQRATTLELFDSLETRLAGRSRPTGVRPTPRDVLSVHVQSRDDGVAEVCATVRRGRRAVALALRLEGHAGAWRCAALDGV